MNLEHAPHCKQLYLLRHAKSSWDFPDLPDFERPLANRGKKALPVIAQAIKSLKTPPDVILTSTAVRALATAAGVRKLLPYSLPMLQEPALYHASPPTILQHLRRLPDQHEAVMLVGHNPGLSDLSEWLCTSSHPSGFLRLPTGGLVWLHLRTDRWARVTPGEAELHALLPVRWTTKLLD